MRRLEHASIEQLIDHFFQRRIDRVQTTHGRSARHGIQDLREIFLFDTGIPNLLWVEHDIRPVVASTEADIRSSVPLSSVRLTQPVATVQQSVETDNSYYLTRCFGLAYFRSV